jgi:hypothetical protein
MDYTRSHATRLYTYLDDKHLYIFPIHMHTAKLAPPHRYFLLFFTMMILSLADFGMTLCSIS